MPGQCLSRRDRGSRPATNRARCYSAQLGTGAVVRWDEVDGGVQHLTARASEPWDGRGDGGRWGRRAARLQGREIKRGETCS